MQHEVTNGWDLICNMKLQMVGTLYATWSSQWSEPCMQHKVANDRYTIGNMKLPMFGTLYAT